MRWHVFPVALGIAIAALAVAPQAIADPSTPCPAPPAVVTGDVYDPNQPIGLGGSGDLTTSIDVSEADDGYITFVTAYVGDGRFSVRLTQPGGDQREIFTAIHPANSLISTSAPAPGRYTVIVEADAPWTIVVR